jgi:hypothetical protein
MRFDRIDWNRAFFKTLREAVVWAFARQLQPYLGHPRLAVLVLHRIQCPEYIPANARSLVCLDMVRNDSLVAGLDRGMFLLRRLAMHLLASTDPQHSSAKRQQQRAHALNTTLTPAALERKLAASDTTCVQLETRVRERHTTMERRDADRRLLTEQQFAKRG